MSGIGREQEKDAGLEHYCHPSCVVCGTRNAGGLGLRFREEADGSVVASFPCDSQYQGYPDRLHGGVVSMLLDAAMTHCLFARNYSKEQLRKMTIRRY